MSSRINLWLGQHNESIQVALFPLWSLNKIGRLGKIDKKNREKMHQLLGRQLKITNFSD